MHLTASLHQVFDQLKYLITHVSAAMYAQPVPALSGSTCVLEHTIHHMALLRVCTWHHGGPRLPENFAVAFSTIKYRERCAQ